MPARKFITFEGGEGSGKSTQARLLAERLRAGGHEVVLTREPGGTPLAERIRDLVLAQKPQSPNAEFLLFAAARAEHLRAVIEPALQRGAFVVCDRFIDSTRVYQGVVGGVDDGLIMELERRTVAPNLPALTFIVDIDPAVGLARAAGRGELSRYDSAQSETHAALRRGFLAIAHDEPQRCVVVDGGRNIEAVERDIWQAVSTRMLGKAS